MKLPKQLYVRIENPGTEDEFLLANATIDEFAEVGETIRAGLYQLVEEVTVTARTEISVDKVD